MQALCVVCFKHCRRYWVSDCKLWCHHQSSCRCYDPWAGGVEISSGVSCKMYFLVVPKVQLLGKDRWNLTKPLNSSSCSKGPVSYCCSSSLRRQKTISRKNTLLTQNFFPVSNSNMWFWEHKNRFVLVVSVVLRSNSSTAWARFHHVWDNSPGTKAHHVHTRMIRFASCSDFQFISSSIKSSAFQNKNLLAAVEWLLLKLTKKARGLFSKKKIRNH